MAAKPATARKNSMRARFGAFKSLTGGENEIGV
jgi:hypothetical protein